MIGSLARYQLPYGERGNAAILVRTEVAGEAGSSFDCETSCGTLVQALLHLCGSADIKD